LIPPTDVPEAPTNVEITDGPYERNFTLSWVESPMAEGRYLSLDLWTGTPYK